MKTSMACLLGSGLNIAVSSANIFEIEVSPFVNHFYILEIIGLPKRDLLDHWLKHYSAKMLVHSKQLIKAYLDTI